MRKAEAGRLVVSGSSRAVGHALRLSAVALGIGLLMASGAARAGDDDEDDKTFEEKVIASRRAIRSRSRRPAIRLRRRISPTAPDRRSRW